MAANTSLKPRTWDTLGTPVTAVVVAGFTGRYGDQPGDLTPKKFFNRFHKAFPVPEGEERKPGRLLLPDRLGLWAVQNVLTNQLSDLPVEGTDQLAERLAVLAGDNEATAAMAEHFTSVIYSRKRSEAVPVLKIMSGLVVANAMDLPPRNPLQ